MHLKRIIMIIILIIIINEREFKNILLKRKKRIGIIGVYHDQNAGNMLVKYSMYIKLKEYGFYPIIVSSIRKGQEKSLDFLKNKVKLKNINNSFFELKMDDYDILMVNSDQTWRMFEKNNFYDIGFLRFAENWTIPKFIYGASFGKDFWPYPKEVDRIVQKLLKNFTGISLRERGSIKLVEEHLGIKSDFVLDPTFLINKNYYLNLIKGIKKNDNFICVYQLDQNKIIKEFIQKASNILNYKIYRVNQSSENYVENFLFGISNSKAVITDSYHGTVFSIIFNKPFISYINTFRGRERFYSLSMAFNISRRILFPTRNETMNINLLKTPLNINKTLFKELKKISLMYLEKHLSIS